MTMPSADGAVFRAQLREVSRNRWVWAYGAALALITEALLRMGGTGPRALTSLLNVVLLVVPLVTTVFGVVYWHAAREFTELLLAQPIGRGRLWRGLYLGLALPLAATFAIGLSVPLVLHRAIDASSIGLLVAFVGTGVALTATFAALALWIAVRTDDRLRALGTALGIWFGITVVYDALIVWATTALTAWPLERALLAAMFANPVDLARTVLVMQVDGAALMGYTGAVLTRLLGGATGATVLLIAMTLWIALPALAARRAFLRRDF